ncbi:MAG: hypothetical protein Pars92KO_03130 [Parasphingorhabdus sp.]
MKKAYSFAIPPSIPKDCASYPEYDADRPAIYGGELVGKPRFRQIAYGTQQRSCSALAGRQAFL